MTLDEIFAALTGYVGDDANKAKEVAIRLQDESKGAPAVAQVIFTKGVSRGKKERDTEVARITREREDAVEKSKELEAELETARSGQKDRATIEKEIEAKYQKKLDAANKRAADAEQQIETLEVDRFVDKVVVQAKKAHNVFDEYAGEIIASRVRKQIVKGEDGKRRFLKPGGKEAYDGETEEELVVAMAADAAKTTPPEFIKTNVGGGSGLNNTGAGSGTSYDPVQAGKDLAAREKRTRENNAVAFK